MMDFFKKLFASSEDDQDHVSSFNEKQAEEEDIEFVDHGVMMVSVERVIGSVGKYHDFDSQFRPKRHVSAKRFNDIKRAMRDNRPLPPVNLYQIRNDYYVLDGNHRVSAAKELGRDDIRAKVTELLSKKNSLENLLYIEKKQFFESTELTEEINLSEVGKYNYLHKQIKRHRNHLINISGDEIDMKKAAQDWYMTIYRPLVTIIRNAKIMKYFPKRTETDLYAYISYHHWERNSKRRYGIGIDRMIPRNMEAFRKTMLEKTAPEYPEMRRSITTFILINVDTKTEMNIINKLYNLEEVQEVHSVHGNVDILVKVVLRRDLLASDAEIIAEFVDRHVRGISGIHSTQTMIPGFSKVKEGFVC
ncbi:MAG: transcriptional regulator [Desulfobacteraceae bacterium]|nr:MAG: transcriptional regulator [Desulfobacteraceae bacterium]